MKQSDLEIPYIAIILFSLIALFPLPYGYYMFLKIIMALCSGATAYLYYRDDKKTILMWLCVAIAILFNPIIPIHLTKEIWMVFNVMVSGVFGYLTYIIKAGKGL